MAGTAGLWFWPATESWRIAGPYPQFGQLGRTAQTLLLPVACRRQLEDLPDDAWTRLKIEFYKDAADAVLKCLAE